MKNYNQLTDLFYDTHISSVIQTLAKVCNENAKKHGFWEDEDAFINLLDKRQIEDSEGILRSRIISLFNSEKIALEHSELSERLETLRKDSTKKDEHCPEFLNIEIEVADLIIRALDFCGRRDLRIGDALIAKMKFNNTRPYKHGKAF